MLICKNTSLTNTRLDLRALKHVSHKTSDSNFLSLLLTYFMPLFSFDHPWKHQKISAFLVFQGV